PPIVPRHPHPPDIFAISVDRVRSPHQRGPEPLWRFPGGPFNVVSAVGSTMRVTIRTPPVGNYRSADNRAQDYPTPEHFPGPCPPLFPGVPCLRPQNRDSSEPDRGCCAPLNDWDLNPKQYANVIRLRPTADTDHK